MEEIRELLQEILQEDLKQIIMSNSRDREYALKIKIRPVMIKGELLFQETLYRGTQVFHENFSGEKMMQRMEELLQNTMKQCEITGESVTATILMSKKGKATVKVKRQAVSAKTEQEKADVREQLAHNREKQYILREGEPVDFMVGLGVQMPDGRISRNRYDKFRQINRYLEFIEDILDQLPGDRTVRIIDFGCGKSYLTFAMYYYLHVMQKRDVEITGLDLKKDVIAHCSQLAESCGYNRLHFEVGDISTYEGENTVDMVVSLHACDTATDYAIHKAVSWGARVILAVPCCQHEVNRQIACSQLQPLLKYGLIKERMAALITDAVRANLLEEQGYDTQILEFIDMEHTPKNLLIRAVKRTSSGKITRGRSVEETMDFLHIEPALKKLFDSEREN